MGCNIHGCIELLEYPNSEYERWKQSYPIQYDRDYYFYGVIADVRNYLELEPISKPRGLPEDVSRGTKYDSDKMGGDGHSHSYLYANELRDYDWMQIIPDGRMLIDAINTTHKALLLLMRFFSHEYEDNGTRIVFWFDN